jgi:hypothetical protein
MKAAVRRNLTQKAAELRKQRESPLPPLIADTGGFRSFAYDDTRVLASPQSCWRAGYIGSVSSKGFPRRPRRRVPISGDQPKTF